MRLAEGRGFRVKPTELKCGRFCVPGKKRILTHWWKPPHSAVRRRDEKDRLAAGVNSAQSWRNGLWNVFLLPWTQFEILPRDLPAR